MDTREHNLRVVVVWKSTVIQERTFTQTSEPTVTVGEADANVISVSAPELPETFEMFRRTDDGYRVRFPERLGGTLTIGDDEWSLEAARGEHWAREVGAVTTSRGEAAVSQVELHTGDWGLFRLGAANVFFQIVEPEARVAGRGLGSVEMPVVATIALAGLLHGAVLLTAFLAFDVDPAIAARQIPNRFVEIGVRDIPDPLEEEDSPTPSEETTAKKAGGEEGKFGAEDSEQPDSEIPPIEGDMVEEAPDPTKIGVNEILSSDALGSGPLKEIFKDSDGFSETLAVATSGDGQELRVGRGVGGTGLRGLGKGGGGEDGFGRIKGLGKVDTGSGGSANADIGSKEARKVDPVVTPGSPKTGDFCDRNDIRRVVSAKADAIKYCYERRLQQQPELAGKVMAQWKIGLDGTVSDASVAQSTLGDRSVESCIARTIGRMRFEKPDGGICVIHYPFVFSGIK